MSIEELGAAIHGRARRLVGEKAGLAILGPGGEVLWSSMREDVLSFAREITRRFSGLWGEGDYYVSTSGEERLIVMKATGSLCLALSAPAREGVMLLALKSVISSFSSVLHEVEAKAEVAGEEEVDVWPLLMVEPGSGRELKVVPHDAVPSLLEPVGPKVIRLDEKTVALIRATDGKSVSDIAEELGMGVEEACSIVARLVEAGILRARVREVLKPDYNAVYSPAPGMSPEEAVKIAGNLGEAASAVMANLDKGYSVLELSWGLRGLGLDVRPGELLEMLRELEARGLVRRVV